MNSRISTLLLLLCALGSCAVLKQNSQGIEGQVTWLEGNQMPMISDEKSGNSMSGGEPIQRVILIYPLINLQDAKMENGLFTSVPLEPIQKIETNTQGEFSLELEPGSYSIFTQEPEGIYANSFDMEGNIQPVTIKKGEWQSLNIKIDYKAYY